MRKFSALLITAVALMGCDQHEHAATAAPDHEGNGAQSVGSPEKIIREFKVTGETTVRFLESEGGVTVTLEGHLDEMAKNKDLENKLSRAATMEAAYRLLDPAGAVPQAILDHDSRPVVPDAGEGSLPGTLDASLSQPSASVGQALAKTSDHANPAGDANWNWTADANWWKADVVGSKCGWHEAAYQTNYTSWDDWRHGWYGKGYLMAASHTWGADAYAWVWWNGAWSLTNTAYIKPRHYIVWVSGDTVKRYRRFKVTGRGGAAARIHWGMTWDSQAPSDLGVICQG